MGTYHLFINPTKKEFFDPLYFGDNPRKYGLFGGVHRFAIRLLLYSSDLSNFEINEELTSWIGTPFLIANDEVATNQDVIKTTSKENPTRNLYQLAKEEYRDISKFLFDFLLCKEEEVRTTLFERAKIHDSLFLKIVECYYKNKDKNIAIGLENYFGKNWSKKYSKAINN